MDSDVKSFVRVNYWQGMLLDAQDFITEQTYHGSKRSIHNSALHGYGVVSGLDITVENNQVSVTPGLALDARGREIVVPETQMVPVPVTAEGHQVLILCLEYEEIAADESPGSDESAPTRVHELFRLSLQPAAEYDHPKDCVVLGRIEVDAQGRVVHVDGEAGRAHAPSVFKLFMLVERLSRRVEDLERRCK